MPDVERTILVSDADTPVGQELVRLFAARGMRVVGATTTAASGPLAVAWNRASPASARAVVLTVLNRFGALDEAVVLCPPDVASGLAHELASAAVSQALDVGLKGPILLVRELLAHFLGQGAGVLSLGLYSARREEEPAPPLERTVREGFRAFASSVMSTCAEKKVLANGFQAFGVSPEEFASFVDKSLEDKGRRMGGRWFTCPTRGGILGRR